MKRELHNGDPDFEPALFSSAHTDALIESLFASIGDGALATDESGIIIRVNAAALKILGRQESDVIGVWYPRVIISFDEEEKRVKIFDRAITRAFLTGQAVAVKRYYQRKNGHKVPVSVTVSPIILNGKPVGAISIFRDITLEHEIDRMKSDFISLASHQLRTPLSAINTYAQMLMAGYMGDLSDRQRDAVQNIIDGSGRMAQLINTLLNIARIENGTIMVHLRRINMNKLASEVAKELRNDAAQHGIKFVFRLADNKMHARTDRLIMKEILTNLITNAIKYTPKKGTVTVSLDQQKNTVILRVADTGIGIPKYSHNNIFSKFFRAPNVVQRETSGTGLGLYMVKGMADRLGAKVWFESKLGKGSTFYISMPLAELPTEK